MITVLPRRLSGPRHVQDGDEVILNEAQQFNVSLFVIHFVGVDEEVWSFLLEADILSEQGASPWMTVVDDQRAVRVDNVFSSSNSVVRTGEFCQGVAQRNGSVFSFAALGARSATGNIIVEGGI